jgi:ABC-type multidrug transport system ATPase subunit/pSer/pThr/pTyr-binding forkhead associated (FHA) protein
MTDFLRVRAGGREAVFAPGVGEIVVGSARGAAVRFPDDSVAARHLVVRFDDGAWTLEALDGDGLTFRDRQAVGTVRITAALALRLGDPLTGPLLELEPGDHGRNDSTADFGSLPAEEQAEVRRAIASVPLSGEVLRIGRDPESDVVVADLQVSRRHAEIRSLGDGRYEAVDLGSHNGTFVNGRRIERVVLEELDVISVGRNSYRLIDGSLAEYVDTGGVAYAAVDLNVRLDDGTVLLDGASFSLESRSMLAVIGPSGSGKSTLLGALTGFRMATEGDVRYGDRSLYADYEALRQRIGYVPQDDIVHPELTVEAELEFAANIRFPSDVEPAERHRRVQEVISELGLDHRRHTQVARLSGGERKRVSVGLELLTAPSLLFLDEPTSGLDPNGERSLMELFRELANRGRTVVVVTHSLQSLRLCDRVLVLAPGGRMAYFGPPQLILAYFDRADFADVFHDLTELGDGIEWGARFRAHPYHATYVERSAAPRRIEAGERAPARQSMGGRWHQFVALSRRYAAVIVADRRNLALLIGQAPLLGLLLLVALPSDQLASLPSADLRLVSQASLVLLTIVLSVSWLGMSNAVREIAKELPIVRRERAAGVSLLAYLGSKALVLGTITILQSVVLIAIALSAQHGPAHAVLLGWPLGEMIVIGALTGVAAMALGLLISAASKTSDRATTVLPIVLVFLLVLALGGVFPAVGDKPVLKQLEYVASTQWGFSGLASTSDLNNLQAVTGELTRTPEVNVDAPGPLFQAFRQHSTEDVLWEHSPSAWLGDAGALLGLTLIGLVGAGAVLLRDHPA